MGRGKKSNQRTKGNVKPSSSSKAAEMLVEDGKTGFIGFGGLSESMGNAFGYVPKSVGYEEADLNIDSELRMLMRKMGKKDTTTRLKAVQEFSELCSTKDSDDVIKILSFWPRIYNKLSEDYDHRVREAVQLAHLEIATKAGRSLAPQLKILISSWMKSLFDQYAPAASAAKMSFDTTFPDDKKKGVILFCKKDLLVNLYETLIKQTADTLSDPKIIPQEERESKYNRLISSSLLSFGYIMEMLQKHNISDISEPLESIFEEKKFWKFSRHNSPMIRAAFFNFLSSACRYNADVLRSHTAVLCPSVLHSLDESEPSVISSFWDCLLHVVYTFEECWSHVNARKAVFPKLWSVLRKGGFGCASMVFPNMLPFLSKIPLKVVGDGIGFAGELFSNMREGLFYEKVASSQTESIAVMKAFMECLRYVLFNFNHENVRDKDELRKTTEDESDMNLIEYLVDVEIGYLIHHSLDFPKRHLWIRTFLTSFRDLLIFVQKNVSEKDDKEYICNQATARSHSVIKNIAVSLLNYETEIICTKERIKHLEELIKIVVFKMEYPNQRHKKQVGFATSDENPEADVEVCIEEEASSDYFLTTDAKPYHFSDWTKSLLHEICSNCIRLLFERRNIIFAEFLSNVVRCLGDSTDFKHTITYILSVRKCLDIESSSRQFKEMGSPYEGVIANIIHPIMESSFSVDYDESFWESTGCQDAVIGLLCKMLKCMDKGERFGFLRSITEISTRPYMFSCLVQKVLGTIDLDASVSWFTTCDIWFQLVTYTSNQFAGDLASCKEKIVFNSLFECIDTCLFFDNGSLCTEAATDKLFAVFKNQLATQFSEGSMLVCKRILALLAKFYSHKFAVDIITNRSTELLIAIFQLMSRLDDSELSKQATFTLKRGFSLLLNSADISHKGKLDSALQNIAYWVQNVCSNTSCEREIQSLANCCAEVICFFNSDEVTDTSSSYSHRFLSQLVNNLDKYLQCTDFSSEASLTDAVLLGTLSVESLPKERLAHQKMSCTEVNNSLFVTKLIISMKEFEVNQETVVNALLDTVCLLCLLAKDNCTQDDADAVSHADKVEAGIKEVLNIENIPSECILNSAVTRALDKGGLHTLALSKLFEILPESTLSRFPVSNLLGRAMSHGQNDAHSLDGLKVVLSHVEDLSVTRALVEQYVDQLCNEDSETLKGFNYVLELCICAVTRWQCMLDNCTESAHDLTTVLQTILTHVIWWKDNSQDALLFSVDLTDAPDEQLSLNINLMKLISFSLDCGGGGKLTSDHWDFILCSLASWIQTCEENIQDLTASYRKMLFTYWACSLCASVCTAFDRQIGGEGVPQSSNTILLKCKCPWNISEDWKSKLSNKISDDLVSEWQEFFTPTIFKSIYSLYKVLLGCCSVRDGHSTMISQLLKSICCALTGMPSALFLDIVVGNRTFEEQLQDGSVPVTSSDVDRKYDDSQIGTIQETYHKFIDLLESEVLCLQVLAHTFLCKLMTVSYSVALSLTTESIEGDECDTIRSFPEKLMDVLNTSQERTISYVEENAAGYGAYLTHSLPTNISRLILSYLLSWQITLRQFRDSEAGRRAAFANFIRKRNMVGPMMRILFSILPNDKGHLLSEDPVVLEVDWLSLHDIRKLAFHLYLIALECIPAVIRSWCNNNLDKKSSIITEKFTTAFASPILCSREMDQVSNSSKTFANMSIKRRPAAREVVAVYSVEEVSMELVVKMSPSHPLGPVTVECGKRVGVSSSQWRQWMLQLTMYLTQQNGTIVDGLALWKRNVDKKFEGVEECMICFSVVHGTNYQLPTIVCRVCKKRFHSACLYKWFNTSNKSTCPLCRTSF